AISDSINSVIQTAISGQANFAAALGGATLEVIEQFQKQALAGALASFFSPENPGPFPLKLLLAGAAIAAVKGLFAKAVGTSRGGGASASIGAARPAISSRNFETERPGMQLVLGGEFRIRNNDLVLALDNGNI